MEAVTYSEKRANVYKQPCVLLQKTAAWQLRVRQIIMRYTSSQYEVISNQKEDKEQRRARCDLRHVWTDSTETWTQKVKVKVKVNVKFTLEQTTKVQRWSIGIALLFFNLDATWWWVVNAKPRPLYQPGKDPVPIV